MGESPDTRRFLSARGHPVIVLMKCVAEAVMNKGVRGLAELVPGASYLYDVANDAVRRMRDRKRSADLRQEVMDAASATLDEVKHAAAEVAREVAADGPIEDRIALEMYLTQIPGAVRQSLRRAEDPTGRTVPADFALGDAGELLRRLPHRVARFRPGQALQGKPGWELAEFLGTGGFGEVWLARNPAFSALKGAVKFGLDPAARDRLLRHEGALVNRVMEHGRHPNVVQLLDAHLEGDAPWLMYEYVPGGDLSGLILAWQSLPPSDRVERATAALGTLADAVGHFHRLSPPLVHRDLKPANILVGGASGEGPGARKGLFSPGLAPPQLKVADFGIGGVGAAASLALEASRRGSTGSLLVSQLAGSYTPLYAGPQQQRGEPPDPRDDVHALGVIGFQMITGKLDATLGADYAKALRKLAVPEPLVELLGDCAAHDPDNRPRDARELAERLERLKHAAPAVVSVSPEWVAPAPPTLAPAKPPAEERPAAVAVHCPRCDELIQSPVGGRSMHCPRCGLDLDKELAARHDLLSRVAPAPAAPRPKPKPVVESPEAKRAGLAVIVVTFGMPILLAAALLVFAILFLSGSRDGSQPPEAKPTTPDDPGTNDPVRPGVKRIDLRGVRAGEWRVTPDGGMVVARVDSVGSPYRVVGVRASDGAEVFAVEADGGFALSPDGERVAVATTKGVEVLNANSGTGLFTLKSLGSPEAWLGFTPDGKALVGVNAGLVGVWPLDTPASDPVLVKAAGVAVEGTATAWVAFDPTGKHFAITNRGKPTAVGTTDGWKVEREVGTREDRVCVFTKDGERVVT